MIQQQQITDVTYARITDITACHPIYQMVAVRKMNPSYMYHVVP